MASLVAQDLIGRKRDGGRWRAAEIDALVAGVRDGAFDDCQLGALLMAAYLRGLDAGETTALTLAMARASERLRWDRTELHGPVVDKHSTGGVGDLVSLVLGPVLAAAGCHVPMISGRALGPMGGTLDKLEAIPGFSAELPRERIERQVVELGLAIVGATADLVPVDRILYATRDLTATVTSVPLIAASIVSKKLVEGLDALALDVKYGSGAVFGSREEAERLAAAMTAVTDGVGLATVVGLSPMDQPLAPVAGNALEVALALAMLRGEARPERLDRLVRQLAARLLARVGFDRPEVTVDAVLADGRAAAVFARMVSAQGGPADLLEHVGARLPVAPVRHALRAATGGKVLAVDAAVVGRQVVLLGGGRTQAGDAVDPAVGIAALPSVGDRVERGDPIAEIHARTAADADAAATALAAAIVIGEAP